ncbi:hypothetical protein L208DRAFT_12962 [Tricholoma matsutake]|nr:hypothetical protein L208DRAFT_12962 [Tricholoma matsutake 945]
MASAQQSRYPTSHTNSRDDSVRLPSLKDLNFDYQRGHRHQESPSPNLPPESSINSQDNSARSWGRSHSTQISSPMPVHQQQQHHHHQLHSHQQHTPPLSAGHDSSPSKIEYPSKPDNGFMTPGIPLSAQTVPVPGSVNISLGARSDDPSQGQSKRSRRGSTNMGAPRDVRTSHVTILFAAFSSSL